MILLTVSIDRSNNEVMWNKHLILLVYWNINKLINCLHILTTMLTIIIRTVEEVIFSKVAISGVESGYVFTLAAT